MSAAELIKLSRREHRTVTEYPTAEEFESLTLDLIAKCDDSVEVSGLGHSGPEARGYTEYWGKHWRVDVVNPKE